jgi:hypothetical protein
LLLQRSHIIDFDLGYLLKKEIILFPLLVTHRPKVPLLPLRIRNRASQVQNSKEVVIEGFTERSPHHDKVPIDESLGEVQVDFFDMMADHELVEVLEHRSRFLLDLPEGEEVLVGPLFGREGGEEGIDQLVRLLREVHLLD